ncbi:MAG TPA: ABC transporter ATP-binding protein [Clostridiales bacterium]|jgi:ATPase subunit of ABC transporter with duplicated ATPase domains|nr:ABC transporter ATP-binding protein [Clostridiales bacterium]
MIECGVKNLKKYFGADLIFENITLDIKQGEKIGVVGKNGVGKTTLMKIIVNEEYQDDGDIYIRSGSRVGYLEQIPDYDDSINGMDILYLAFTHLYKIKDEMKELEDRLKNAGEGNHERLIKIYGKLEEKYELKGGYQIDEKLSKVIGGLGIQELVKRKFNTLSGGEKTKIILGKVLLEEPDILLLDEPTNHLDMSSVEWLQTYLAEYKGAVMLISHDRYFLDSIAEKIIEITPNEAQIYYGNYSYYVVEKERRFLEAYKHYKNQQRKINAMEDQIKRYRIWGKSRDSDKMYKRAKELEKRLEKMDRLERPKLNSRKIRLNAEGVNRSGFKVVTLENISKSYNKKLFQNINLEIYYGDSVGLIGDNGTGKTTLLRIIEGSENPDKGEIKLGARVKVGYLRQEEEFENTSMDLVEYYHRELDITLSEARNQLAKVLFTGDDVFKTLDVLSGGEKTRLKLGILLYRKVNLLILDEPTNHLDIDSREILEETLTEFDGTILFVSHDRYFINKLADRIVEIEDKKIRNYNGDYDYYKMKKAEILEMEAERKKREKEEALKNSSKEKEEKKLNDKLSKNQRRILSKEKEDVEKKIENIEKVIEEIELSMNENKRDGQKLKELYLEKEEYQNKIEDLMERWEELIILLGDE